MSEPTATDVEMSSADALARLVAQVAPPRPGVTDVLSPAEAYERILAAWRADVATARNAAFDDIIEALGDKVRPGHRVPVVDRNGRLMTATKIREWLVAMVEALR